MQMQWQQKLFHASMFSRQASPRLMSRKINQRWVSMRTLRKCGVNIPIKIAKSVLGIMQKLDYKFHISIPDNLIIIAHSITTDEYLYE